MIISRLLKSVAKRNFAPFAQDFISIFRGRKSFFPLFLLVLSSTLTGCSSYLGLGVEGASEDIRVDNTEVHSLATSNLLNQDMEMVSNDYRDLKSRFDVLERLYLDLAGHTGFENKTVQAVITNSNQSRENAVLESDLKNVKSEISLLKDQLSMMKNRLSAENGLENQPVPPSPDIQSTEDQSKKMDNADQLNAALDVKKNEISDPSFQYDQAPVSQTPLSEQPVLPATFNQQKRGVLNGSSSNPLGQQYGIHLESLRQKKQALNRWRQAKESFPDILGQGTPVLYRQSTASLTILRLIAGPYMSQNSADKACEMIKFEAPERYCRVTEYIGEPLIG